MSAVEEDLIAETTVLSTVEQAIEAVCRGEVVIVADDPGRENEGDFVMAAELATPETVNFMVTHGRGILCMPIMPERAEALDLPLMKRSPAESKGCAFTVSIDLLDPPSTGTSAFDRARCIARAARPDATAGEFRRPGHVFPLIARPGGVLERPGHTEAAVDLARMAGLGPAGVICEILGADGSMAGMDELPAVARRHGLHLITVADLVAFRLQRETHVRPTAGARIPTAAGPFSAITFVSDVDGSEHVALTTGDVSGDDVLVRVHSECLAGDVLGGLGCDCRARLDASMRTIAAEGRGAVVYLRSPAHDAPVGCGAGLGSLDAAAQILRALGVRSARLLNDSATRLALEARGVRAGEAPGTRAHAAGEADAPVVGAASA